MGSPGRPRTTHKFSLKFYYYYSETKKNRSKRSPSSFPRSLSSQPRRKTPRVRVPRPQPRRDVGTSDRHSRAPPLPAARHRRERLPHLASRPTPARPTPAAPPAPPVHRRPAPDASSRRPLAPHGGRCHPLHCPGRLAAWPQPTGPCPTPGG